MIRFFNLVILVLFASSAALASRAKMTSLQNNQHFPDLENAFLFPTKSFDLFPMVTFESGLTSAASAQTNAYVVGLWQQNSDVNWLYSLGRQNKTVQQSRERYQAITSENLELANNSVQITRNQKIAGIGYSLGVSYSGRKDQMADEYENAETIMAGLRFGHWSFSAEYAFKNQQQIPSFKYINIKNNLMLAALYEVDNLTLSAQFNYLSGRQENSGLESQSFDDQSYTFSFSDNSLFQSKLFFYKIDLLINNLKYNLSTVRERSNQLPISFGFENPISDLFKVRGSMKQTFLLNNNQDMAAADNNTNVAVGVSYENSRVIVDSVLQGLTGNAANQKIDGNQLLSQVSVTYLF